MSKKHSITRRAFVKNTGLTAITLGLTGPGSFAALTNTPVNKLPKWRGFNILDFFAPDPARARRPTPEEHFKWMSNWGFDFIRLPMAYPNYLDIDRTKPITADDVYKIDAKRVDKIDEFVSMAHKYNIHVSLNLHRAPGYCINSGFVEPFHLWKDEAAQKAFYFHWELWAKRYKDVSSKKISFDLLNEPCMREDMNDQFSRSGAVPGELYRKVAKAAAEAIRKYNPNHLVIADGNNVGNEVINEIIDLNIAQSCRGYNPGTISHYKAPWASKDPNNMPTPVWPGKMGGQYMDRKMLENAFAPWIEVMKKGVGVHCGECGCWNKTPHAVFLAWFEDVLDILSSNGIGFGLWEFSGTFGVLNSLREDVAYEDWHGSKLDRKLLNLLLKY